MSGPLFSGPLIDILRQAPPFLAHQADEADGKLPHSPARQKQQQSHHSRDRERQGRRRSPAAQLHDDPRDLDSHQGGQKGQQSHCGEHGPAEQERHRHNAGGRQYDHAPQPRQAVKRRHGPQPPEAEPGIFHDGVAQIGRRQLPGPAQPGDDFLRPQALSLQLQQLALNFLDDVHPLRGGHRPEAAVYVLQIEKHFLGMWSKNVYNAAERAKSAIISSKSSNTLHRTLNFTPSLHQMKKTSDVVFKFLTNRKK